MQIIAGGELKKTTEFITKVNSGIEGTAGIEGCAGTEKNALSKIFAFLSGANNQCRSRCKYESFKKI